jgi:AcrR family transcriptional regulator
MKERTAHRPYKQRRRAAAAEANTERILQAANELFEERPWDQITFAAVAERAGVGTQTIIRRFGTKDGVARAVTAWLTPQIEAARDVPVGTPPADIAAALARHYERWGESVDRTLRQQDASPALAEAAAGGRAAHRAWVERVFPNASSDTTGRLIGICGVELWLVLRRDGGLSPGAARSAVADLIAATLP